MRKKHDEGYVLVFVMVVIAVLSLVAITLMTGALKNLQAQSASIERMKDKYVAEGMIEVAAQELLDGMPIINVFGTFRSKQEIDDKFYTDIGDAIIMVLQPIADKFANDEAKIQKLEYEPLERGDWEFDNQENGSCVVKLKATYGSVSVKCELVLEKVIFRTVDADAANQDKWEYVKPVAYHYKSYAVISTGGDS